MRAVRLRRPPPGPRHRWAGALRAAHRAGPGERRLLRGGFARRGVPTDWRRSCVPARHHLHLPL